MNLIGEADIQVEQSVLGAVFLDPDVLDEIIFLEKRDFVLPRHQIIYEVMRYLEKRGDPVDVVTVTAALAKFGGIEKVGGVSYLSELAAACPTTANTEYYARIIRSKALERRAKNTAEIIMGMSRDDYESDEEFFSRIEGLVQALRPEENYKMRSFRESRADYFKYRRTKAETIPTGFPQFDAWSMGLWRGWLFVSAGRPSVGKTALMLQRAYNIAMAKLGSVLIFSQEMDENQVKDRMISSATGISYKKIQSKNLSEREEGQVELAHEALELLPIFIQDTPRVSIDEIRATARQYKKKYGKIAMIAVDYLQIMHIPQRKGETRAQAIGIVTSEAKAIARELNCCFMMLSQMSRDFEKALKPQLSHLKESGSIEQDADVVEFLWHDPEDTVMGGKVIQQTIAKGRDTGLNEFRLLFQGWIQRFKELPREK